MATCTSCQTPFQIPDPSSHASPLVDLGHQNKLTSNPASTSVQQQPIPNSDSRLLVYGLLGLGATMFVGMLFIGLVIYVVSKPTDGEVVERPPAVENSEEGEVVSVPPSDLVKPSTEDPSIPTRRPPISAAKLGSLPDFSVAKRAKFDTRFRYFWPKHSLECVFEIKASLDGRKFGNEAESKITGYTTYSPSSSTPESILKRLPKSSVTKGIGSGFVVHPDGIIVTCEHVVSGADNINVTLNGKQYQGRVIDSDAERDLAILKIDATDLPYLEIASSKSTRLTEQIAVIGYPLSDVLGKNVKVNMGAISGLNAKDGKGMLQVDATINPGNSGGPMVNKHGQILGVITALLASDKLSEVGFAVPSSAVETMLKKHKIPFQSAASSELEGLDAIQSAIKAVAYLEIAAGRGNIDTRNSEVRNVTVNYKVEGLLNAPAKREVSKQMVVGPFGQIHFHSGELQFPFFVGQAGEIGVEPFPRDGRKKWARTELVVIPVAFETKVEDRFRPSTFRNRGSTTTRLLIPAVRTSNYRMGTETDGLITVHKDLKLAVINPTSGNFDDGFTMTGRGQYKFDTNRGMIVTGDTTYKLSVNGAAGSNQISIRQRYLFREPSQIRVYETFDDAVRTAERERLATAKNSDHTSSRLSMYTPVARLRSATPAKFSPPKGNDGLVAEYEVDGWLVESLDFSPTGRYLAYDYQGYVQLIDLESEQRLARGAPISGQNRTTLVRFAPDGKTLVSAGRRGGIQVWDFTDISLGKHRVVDLHEEQLQGLAFDQKGARAFSVDESNLNCWNVASGQRIWSLKAESNQLFAGRTLYVAQGSGQALIVRGSELLLLDANSGKILQKMHVGSVASSSVSGDGRLLATTRKWRVISLRTGRDYKPRSIDPPNVWFTHNPRFLLVSGGFSIFLMDVEKDEKRREFRMNHGARVIAISPDGLHFAVAGDNRNGAIKIFRLPDYVTAH